MWPTLLASKTPAPKEKELWESLPGPTWQHANKKHLCAAMGRATMDLNIDATAKALLTHKIWRFFALANCMDLKAAAMYLGTLNG